MLDVISVGSKLNHILMLAAGNMKYVGRLKLTCADAKASEKDPEKAAWQHFPRLSTSPPARFDLITNSKQTFSCFKTRKKCQAALKDFDLEWNSIMLDKSRFSFPPVQVKSFACLVRVNLTS